MKLKTVRKGWRLDRVLYVSVAAAKLFKGKIPVFQPGTNGVSGRWNGGNSWPSNNIAGPWGLPGVV